MGGITPLQCLSHSFIYHPNGGQAIFIGRRGIRHDHICIGHTVLYWHLHVSIAFHLGGCRWKLACISSPGPCDMPMVTSAVCETCN